MKKILLYPLVILFSFFIVACSDDNSPEGITKHFIESTYKGDADAMVKALDLGKDGEDPMVQQMIVGKMGMAAAEAKANSEAQGGISKIDIKNVKYLNDDQSRATVNFVVTFKKGEEDAGDMTTVKTAKGWKIAL